MSRQRVIGVLTATAAIAGGAAAIALALALGLGLAGDQAALAATVIPAAPTLERPAQNAQVKQGVVELIVLDRSPQAAKYGVFAQISPVRKVKGGTLQTCDVSKGCDFFALQPVKRHPGLYEFTTHAYKFKGWWASTPHRYFWQAHHIDCTVKSCDVDSKIGSFRVVAK